MSLKPYQIETSDKTAVIIVQACCEEWANVAVSLNGLRRWRNGGFVCHRLKLPELVYETEPLYYTQMKDDVYRAYIEANKAEILALIARLNSPDYPTAGFGDRDFVKILNQSDYGVIKKGML